ncbi:MAG TPA: PfkB family carbohydrate kinase [Blastocatellia bacterium]|nr:PfkB family carbohydrate kinase [Blastocatellia bacterium]
MSVLVVGSVAFDSIKTPFGERNRALGGSATFFSVAASFFTDVRVVAVVGEDFGAEEEAVFREREIDLSDLERIEGQPSFHWKGEYGYDLNVARTLDTQLNVFADFNPKLSDAARETPFLFLGNIQPQLQVEVRRQVAAKLVAADTMNYWIDNTRDDLIEMLKHIDILIINDSEARELAGEANLVRAARKILSMGPGRLVVKRGEYGAAMFTADTYFATPAYPLEDVFDPTGAGDSFAGGFMGYLAAADSTGEAAMRRAIIYGSVMASFNVEEFSCDRLRRLTHDEISARFRELRALSHFEEEELPRRRLLKEV